MTTHKRSAVRSLPLNPGEQEAMDIVRTLMKDWGQGNASDAFPVPEFTDPVVLAGVIRWLAVMAASGFEAEARVSRVDPLAYINELFDRRLQRAGVQ